MKKRIAAILSAWMLIQALAGCAGQSIAAKDHLVSAVSGDVNLQLAVSGGFSALKDTNPGIASKLKAEDMEYAWDNHSATMITLKGSSAAVSGAGAKAKGSKVSITAAGTYVLSGTLTDGQIVIDAAKTDLVRLILNGVDITNKSGAAIYAAQCDKMILTLAEGTENRMTDGGSNYLYADEAQQEPNAAIFSKDDLTINGTGSLAVHAGFKNGIGTKDDLRIISGDIKITAANNAVRGNDSVVIIGGCLSIDSEGDGIKTSNDGEKDKGSIDILDGIFDISSAQDGIQAENALTIYGGTFTITAGGGSASAPVRAEEFGGRGVGGGMQRIQTPAETQTDTEATSWKALKAVQELSISGGVFSIDARDDGIHSNGDVVITNGTFDIQTGDDGIHADNMVKIEGGEIHIPRCYEGIEGLVVLIIGGDISIIASDDGMNASRNGSGEGIGGARMPNAMTPGGQRPNAQAQDGQGLRGMDTATLRKVMDIIGAAGADGFSEEQLEQLRSLNLTQEQIEQFSIMARGSMGMNGAMNEPRANAVEGAYIRISGGSLDIWGRTDGIDSNGHLYIDGGIVKVGGQSSGAESALEMDGDFVVTGGAFITAGSIYTPGPDSTQPVVRLSYASQQAAGSVITVKDSTGNVVLEYTARIAFSASGFTSPAFKIGDTVSLFINGEKRTDITISDMVTSIAEDGGAYRVSMSGMGGGRAMMEGAGGVEPPGSGMTPPPGGGTPPDGSMAPRGGVLGRRPGDGENRGR